MRQGSPFGAKQSTSEYGRFFVSNRNSEQKNLFSSPREALTVSTSRNKLMSATSQNDPLSFKKRIADSVASRLSPGKQDGDSPLLVTRKRKSVKNEGPQTHTDIWGLKMANPTNLTLSTYSPSSKKYDFALKLAHMLLFLSKLGSNAPSANPATGLGQKLDLNSNIEALNRIRKSSTKEHASAKNL